MIIIFSTDIMLINPIVGLVGNNVGNAGSIFSHGSVVIGKIEISSVSPFASPTVFNYPCTIARWCDKEVVFGIIVIPSDNTDSVVC